MNSSTQTILTGPGAIQNLSSLVSGKALIITDPGIVRAGHLDLALSLVPNAEVFDQARENPTESDIEACAAFARQTQPDLLIGLGGGSSLDTAKGTLFLLSGGGKMSDYQGHGKAKGSMLPFIAIPTTAGTGSECQSYAIVCRDQSHAKMACGDPRALAHTVILDPQLTASLPLNVARLTALDALSHALESLVSLKATPASQALSRAAFQKIEPAIEAVLTGKATVTERAAMLEGAALAGQAIEASMLGAAHATANPLTAHLNTPHGHAVLTTLPAVMRWNEPLVGSHYHSLRPDLISWVERLRTLAQLSPVTVPPTLLPDLVADASQQWTLQFNPRPLNPPDLESLYREVLHLPSK